MNPRLGLLRPYPFERLRSLLSGTQPPAGLRPIALSIGEPKHEPPAFVARALTAALGTLGTYPTSIGLPELRSAIARWLERRYGLPQGHVRDDEQVLPVAGTREGLFSFVQAVVDPGAHRPAVLMPNPFYQIYEGATLLAGAEPVYLDCTASNAYLPDLDAVPDSTWARCQLLFLCSPGNPTGAVLPEALLRRALELADRHGFVVAADECYSEIYGDDVHPPCGLLQAAYRAGNGSFERCAVFHSLSKRSSVPGLRSGFVAGDARVLEAFRRYRTYHGCALPVHTQLASVPAWNDERHVEENRRLYREKFDRVVPILAQVLPAERPDGAFYLWLDTGDDEAFARGLYEQTHVTVLPGTYLGRDGGNGNPGRGRVRISLVASVAETVEAAHRIAEFARRR